MIFGFYGYSVSTSTNTITYSVLQGEGSVALVFGTYNIRDSPVDDAYLVLVGAAHRVVNVVIGAMNKRWCLVTTCARLSFRKSLAIGLAITERAPRACPPRPSAATQTTFVKTAH